MAPLSSWDWTWTGGSASTVNPTVSLPDGTTVITLTVIDNDGATDTDTVSITVGVACTSSKAMPANQWVFFSLPCMPADASAANVFSAGPVAVDYGTRWIIWAYNNSISDYEHLAAGESLIAGKGYLFYSLDAFGTGNEAQVAGANNPGNPYPVITVS